MKRPENDNIAFADWIYSQIQTHTPSDVLIKIMTFQPLTKEEFTSYQPVIMLVAQLMILRGQGAAQRKLTNLTSAMSKSLANIRDILYHVSDDPEEYHDRDGRAINDVKSAAVRKACERIRENPQCEERVIALKVFNEFRNEPRFYDDFESFAKQVKRHLGSFDSDFWT